MKHHDVNRIVSLLVAIMLIVSSCAVLSVAAGQEGSYNVDNQVDLAKECDLSQNQAKDTYYNLSSRDLMSPNKTYQIEMTFINKSNYPLPDDTNANPMVYSLAAYGYVTVKDGSNDEVVWEYDEENKEIVFRWTNGKKDSFSATIEYTLKDGLTGSTNLKGKTFVLARYNTQGGNNKANTVTNVLSSGGMLKAQEIIFDAEGNYTSTKEVTAWTFDHVSDDWYLIHHGNSGSEYLALDSKAGNSAIGTVSLVSRDAAKALHVTYYHGAVCIANDDGFYLNDKGNGGSGRFQAYKRPYDQNNFLYLLPVSGTSTLVTVEFDANGLPLTVPAAQTWRIGSEVALDIPEEMEGYDFAGWSTSTKAEGLIRNPKKYVVSGDSTLYAIGAKHVDIPVKIKWDDHNDEDGNRPKSVTIQLKANGENLGDEVTLTAGNANEEGDWEYTFTDLHAIDGNGKAIVYTVDEQTPAYYYVVYPSAGAYELINRTGSALTLTKKVVGETWVVCCDVMATTVKTNSNGEIWKTDVISNPTEAWSLEGHRLNKCGDKEHWVIWVGADGIPFRMDEIKSGATGKTLPTKIYKPRNSFTDDEIWSMTPADTANVIKFRQNYIDDMPWEDIHPNQRIYWVTWNGNNIWYHTGITRKADVKYILYIDENRYELVADDKIVLGMDDLGPGTHWISEKSDPNCYLGQVTVNGEEVQPDGDWKVQIEIPETPENINIEWPNVTKLPDKNDPDPPTDPLVDISIRKIWVDDDDRDGLRPEKGLDVTLLADGKPIETVTLKPSEDETKNWACTIKDLPKYKDKHNKIPFEYTWSEDLPDGYFCDPDPETGDVIITKTETSEHTQLTNHHVPEQTEIEVIKEWNDINNPDGIHPESIEVTLTGTIPGDGDNGTREVYRETKIIKEDEEGQWGCRFTDLYGYCEGKRINYQVTETAIESFETTISGLTPIRNSDNIVTGYSVKIENKYSPKTSVSATKVWDDNGNQDGKRDAVTLVLIGTYQDGTETKTVTPENNEKTIAADAAGDDLTVTWDQLDRFAGGHEITYTVTEKNTTKDGKILLNDAEYEVTVTGDEGKGFTVTNSHTPEETEATVRKVWNDAENQDGIRPAELKATLSNGTEVTLNEANGWTATIGNLPKYKDGEEIAYTWTEGALPDGYQLTDTTVNGTVTTLTNSHTPEVTEATVRKVWDDAENQDGIRPAELKATLSNGAEVTLNEANGWTATIGNLPKYKDGEEIAYTWTEGALPEGYQLTDTAVNGTVTTLTNSHTPEETEATVRKVWNDAGDQDGIRPAELKVKLSNGAEVTLNEANRWTATIGNLPKYQNGKEIAYTWTEGALPTGYRLTGTNVNGTVTTLTNSHTPETTEATVRKVWDDAENQDGIRPAELKVKLSSGAEVTLNEANGWTATVGNLPKNKNGKEIAYTWKEGTLPEGYQLTDTTVNGTVTTLTNTHTPELISLVVRKEWVDQNDELKLRPASVQMTLSNNMTVTLNTENGWSAEIKDLPAYSDGKLIEYTWTEQTVLGYTQVSAVTTGNVTTFTNRLYDRTEDQPDQPAQGGAIPRMAGQPVEGIEDYGTPLGVDVEFNHVGDCFD